MDANISQPQEPHVPPASDAAPPMPINPPSTPSGNNKFGTMFSRPNKKVVATIFGFLLLTTSVGVGVYLSQQKQKTGVSAALVNLSLTTSRATPAVNENFVVGVSMNPNGMAVNGVDLRIQFDPTKLTATSITPAQLLPNTLISGSVSGNTAMIVLSAPIDAAGPHPVTTSGLIAQVQFKAIAAGATQVTFGTSTTVSVSGLSTNGVGTKTGVTITVGGTGTGLRTPTPTGIRTATPLPSGTRTPTPRPSGTRTPTPRPSVTPTPRVCGGIAGLPCPTGYVCIYSDGTTRAPFPDAQGRCIRPTPRPTGTRTPTPRPSGTRTPTPRPSSTRTPTPRVTGTRTPTPRGTATRTPTVRPTGTRTPTPRATATHTPTIRPTGTNIASATPTPTIIPGDINRDGQVSIVDVGILVDNYNQAPPSDPRADIDGNGVVNIVDVGILVDNYGRGVNE